MLQSPMVSDIPVSYIFFFFSKGRRLHLPTRELRTDSPGSSLREEENKVNDPEGAFLTYSICPSPPPPGPTPSLPTDHVLI